MASSIRVRATASNGVTSIKSLIRHPMDSGYVKDADGEIIPPHYIKVVTFSLGGKTVFTADWGPAVSKDPYLEFRIKGGKKGDTLTVDWVDSEGEKDSTTAKIM